MKYKVLEIFAHGGISIWETLWLQKIKSNKQWWERLFPNEKNNQYDWKGFEMNSLGWKDGSSKMPTPSKFANDIYWSPALSSVQDHIKKRTRMVCLSHKDAGTCLHASALTSAMTDNSKKLLGNRLSKELSSIYITPLGLPNTPSRHLKEVGDSLFEQIIGQYDGGVLSKLSKPAERLVLKRKGSVSDVKFGSGQKIEEVNLEKVNLKYIDPKDEFKTFEHTYNWPKALVQESINQLSSKDHVCFFDPGIIQTFAGWSGYDTHPFGSNSPWNNKPGHLTVTINNIYFLFQELSKALTKDLMDKTLIVIHSEFTRSPSSFEYFKCGCEEGTKAGGLGCGALSNGRNHWNKAYIGLLIGGPIKKTSLGGSIRNTSEDPNICIPETENGFTPNNLQETMYCTLEGKYSSNPLVKRVLGLN